MNVLPSKSLTPPSDDHDVVVALYPSYCPLSVLNLIAPFSTTAEDGLAAVSPAGMIIADVVFILATLVAAGLIRISKPERDLISLSSISIWSLLLNLSNVLTNPLVVNAPVLPTISTTFVCGEDPIKKLPLFTILSAVEVILVLELIVVSDTISPTILGAVKFPVTDPVATSRSVPEKVRADKIPASMSAIITSVEAIVWTKILNPLPNVFGLLASTVIDADPPNPALFWE